MEINVENGAVQFGNDVFTALQDNAMTLLAIGVGLGVVWLGICYNKLRQQPAIAIVPPSMAVLPNNQVAALPLETEEAAAAPLETAKADVLPLEIAEAAAALSETAESAAAPLETAESAAAPLDTTESAAEPLDTAESAAVPLDTAESAAAPSKTAESVDFDQSFVLLDKAPAKITGHPEPSEKKSVLMEERESTTDSKLGKLEVSELTASMVRDGWAAIS